jgi:dienelactone hydrolase
MAQPIHITKRSLFSLAAAGLATPALAQGPAATPSSPVAGIAPPRTLPELKAEVILRAGKQTYPLDGVALADAEIAMADLKSTSPDEWARVWIARGDAKIQQAQAARPTNQAQLYRAAWALYSVGRFPAPTSPGRRLSYSKALDAYRAFVARIDPPLEVVRIPFEGHEIVGYLRSPPNAGGPSPLLISTGGIDNLKEQVAHQGLVFLDHGFAVFAVDMPGTGESPVKADAGAERVFSRVLDWARTRPEIDAQRIFFKGGSWGGHWATRMALSEKDRLLGAISQAGPAARFYTEEWQMKALGTREYLLDLFDARAAIYGVSTLPEFLAYGRRLSLLNDGLIDQPSAPMLVINGALDTQVPIDDQFLLLTRGDAKDAWINPKGLHMGFGGGWDRRRVDEKVIIPWMNRMMGRS